jgi:hypothetical protein
MTLSSELTFQPVGYPANFVNLLVSLSADKVTYTATLNTAPFFTNGVASNQNQTLTFSTIVSGVGIAFSGGPNLLVSTASLTLTLTINQAISGNGAEAGTLAGTLSVTGTPFNGGGTVTVSGPVTGNFVGRTAQ